MAWWHDGWQFSDAKIQGAEVGIRIITSVRGWNMRIFDSKLKKKCAEMKHLKPMPSIYDNPGCRLGFPSTLIANRKYSAQDWNVSWSLCGTSLKHDVVPKVSFRHLSRFRGKKNHGISTCVSSHQKSMGFWWVFDVFSLCFPRKNSPSGSWPRDDWPTFGCTGQLHGVKPPGVPLC